MAFIKKLALGSIFISILCIFAMSHNANAIEFTLNLNDYTLHRDDYGNSLDVYWNDNTTSCNGVNQCQSFYSSDFTKIKRLRTHGAFNLKADDIVVLRLFIGSQSAQGSYTTTSPFIMRNFTTNQDNFIYIGQKEHIVNNQNILSQLGYGPNANEFYTQLTTIYQDLRIYEYYFKVQADGAYYVGFESPSYTNPSRDIFTYPAYSSSSAIYYQNLSTQVFRYNGSEENREVEEKTQEAVDDSQAAGSDSSSAASGGGANLLTAITGFFNVITSAQPTNCRFNAPLNTYFGNENLNVDLCALDLPQGIGALTSIIAIGILIPFAIHMFNKFIALFRSFQS